MRRLAGWMLLCWLLPVQAAEEDGLWTKFCRPPADARTKVWWFHGETVTTEAGIDADLEAFRAAGIGGVVFYDQVHGEAGDAFDAMSPAWWRTLKYAARKAQELGLTFEVAASNGYVSGGPWITPELGMQQVTVADTLLTVAERQSVQLPFAPADPHFREIATLLFPDDEAFRPLMVTTEKHLLQNNEQLECCCDAGAPVEIGAVSYWSTPRGKGSTGSMNIPGAPQERYFGALYTELPPLGELAYSLDGREWHSAAVLPAVENVIGYKSKERTVSFPTVRGRWFRLRVHDWVDDEGRFPTLQIDRVQLWPRDRVDNWEVKSGLRTEVTYPHPEGGNRGAIDPALVRDLTGCSEVLLEPGTWHLLRVGYVPTGGRTKHGRRNLLGLEADVMSAEAVTVHFNHYFKAICDTLAAAGCKPAGMCMDSHEAGIQNWTPGFEHRFRALRGYDLIPWLPALAGYIVADRDRTEQVLRDFRHTIAETIASEYYGTLARLCHAEGVTFTSQAMLNIANDNLLSRSKADKPQGEFWAYQTHGNYDCLDAASAAHLYGRPVASAEAFTDTPYTATWNELRRIADLAYCRGINEFVVCASSYQPWSDRKFDDSASAHPYVFHRHHPDWAASGPFWEYQARCAALLREGNPVIDLCIYVGEEVPLKTFAYKLPVVPEGYNFDICNGDALLHRFSARDGRLAVEGGMEYGVLVVQDRTRISPEAEARLRELEAAGVPVIWCNRGETVAEGVARIGLHPDLGVTSGNRPDDRISFFHRRTQLEEIYFVCNHSEHAFDGPVTLRTTRRHAEVWHPDSGTREAADFSPEGSLRLQLAPYESCFVIIR